jgi:cyclopropane fatty-acyl-phospholipid synthase-like methyltransferase
MTPELPFAEACERNKAPILSCLRTLLPGRGQVLEIGSGTGQHVVHFAPRFERLSWQPSERRELLPGLNARIRTEGCARVLPAIELDVFGAWPDREYAAVFSANTAHIMSWQGVCAMFSGVGRRLRSGGPFCLYGPFNIGGRFTSASNREFDRSLRERDPDMGLRDAEALDSLARDHQMVLQECLQLPANNLLLVFRRHD